MSTPLWNPLVGGYSSRRGTWRFRMGVVAFVAATALLFMPCALGMHACSGDPTTAVLPLTLVMEAIIVILLVTGRHRRFVIGFLAALCATGVLSRGQVLAPWATPVTAAYRATSQAVASIVRVVGYPRRRAAWVAAHRGAPLDEGAAAQLVKAVQECASAYNAADTLYSYPRDAATMQSWPGCSFPAGARVGEDSARARYGASDAGWRWSFEPALPDSVGRIASYKVTVVEDSVLARSGARFIGDESGIVEILAPGQPPLVVGSPVAALLELRRCMQRVPAELARMTPFSRAYAEGYSTPLQMLLAQCRGADGWSTESITGSRGATLAITRKGREGGSVDTVGVFTLWLTPVDEAKFLYAMTLNAGGGPGVEGHAGTRNYFLAGDGSVHVTGRLVAATAADPLVEECRLGIAPEACGAP